MNSGKLGKRFFKELTRSPKKSAVLALISVVALWFWAPLVWGWIVPEGEATPAEETPQQAVGVVVPQAVAASPAANGKEQEMTWKELLQLYEEQSLRTPFVQSQSLSNPFAVPEVEQPEEEPDSQQMEEGVAKSQVPQVNPQQLGLSLQATIVSPQLRLATINGKSCQLGSVLVVPANGGVVEFTLTVVENDRIELTGAGQTFELQLRQNAGSITLTRFEEQSSQWAATGKEMQRIMFGPSVE